jgi:hypothetical protein
LASFLASRSFGIMVLCRWTIALAFLIVLAGTGGHFAHTSAQPTPAVGQKLPPAFDQASIDRRIQALQPTAKEKRFEAIGWATGILEAERLARENKRPVFLFCNVGEMGIGRC